MFIWALHRRLSVRHFALAVLSLLLISFMLIPGTTPVAAMALNGSQQSGTNANGEGYRLFTLANLTDVSTITVHMAAGTGYIAVFAADQGTTAPLPTVEQTPPWHLVGTREYVENDTDVPDATFDLSPVARTSSILVLSRTLDGNGGPAPTGMTASGTVIAPSVQPRRYDGSPTATVQVRPTTPMATATTKVPTRTAVAATVAPTATRPPTVAPTASPGATVIRSTATRGATMIPSTATAVAVNNGTPAAQCHDLGDGAVDQHGVSVDVWAPGLRQACGFLGYENGDNPMPSGTPFDAPRPFRFDYTYDHNEAVYGFKVFYYHGAPNGCGDVREILHQGGGTKGFSEEYHTYQVAIAQCSNNADRATMHIMDIGGQADLGCLLTRTEFNATGETCQRAHTDGSQGERITPDINTCRNAVFGADCITSWYPTINFSGPNGVGGGVETTLIVNDPISLVDPADITRIVKTNDFSAGAAGQYNGVKRGMSLLLVYGVSSTTSQRWSSVWDATAHNQVTVPAGTPGAWPMRVDAGFVTDSTGVTMHYDDGHPSGFGDNTGTEGASTQRHGATVSTGIVYPN